MHETPDYPESRLTEAQGLLELPMDELYAQIMQQSPTRGLGDAKKRYEVIVQRCQGAICANERVRFLCRSRNADRITHLVCAVADSIIHVMGVPVPAMTVAAIAVNSGLDRLCAAQWQE
jgi:hypothetical protein